MKEFTEQEQQAAEEERHERIVSKAMEMRAKFAMQCYHPIFEVIQEFIEENVDPEDEEFPVSEPGIWMVTLGVVLAKSMVPAEMRHLVADSMCVGIKKQLKLDTHD